MGADTLATEELQTVVVSSQAEPIDSTRVVIGLVAPTSLALGAYAPGWVTGLGPVREAGLISFCLLGIGSAPWHQVSVGVYSRLALTFGSVLTLGSLAMIGLHALGMYIIGFARPRILPRARLPIALLGGATLAVIHQLSPYVVGGAPVVLVAFRQVHPWWFPRLVLVPAFVWIGLHWDAVRTFLDIDTIGRANNFRPPGWSVIRRGDLGAVRAFQSDGGPRPPYPPYLLLLEPGDHPTSPDERGGSHLVWGRDRVDLLSSEPGSLDAGCEMRLLTRRFVDGAQEPTTHASLFAMWSPAAADYGRDYAVQRRVHSVLLEAFGQAPYRTVTISLKGTYLFHFRPERYRQVP